MPKTDGNIKSVLKTLSHKTKDFLLSKSSREFFVFMFFFLLAGSFWLLQTLNNDYEIELSVPVRLRGVPNEAVVITEPTSYIRIKVRDRGTVLVNYMLGKDFYPLNIDFGKQDKNAENMLRVMPEDLHKKIHAQLKNSTQLLAVTPDTLEYIYSMGSSKRVPVRLQGKVSAARRYYVADTLLTPDSVTVYASSAVLDTISAAYTTHFEALGISDTLRSQLQLHTPKGVRFKPEVINAVLPVDVYTQKTVEVPLVGINFPPNTMLRAFPSKVKVTFQVGSRQFNDFDASDFAIYVPYEELLKLGTEKYNVELNHAPAEVNNVHLSPTQVDFLIEKTL